MLVAKAIFEQRLLFLSSLQKHTVRRRGDQCIDALSALPQRAEFTLCVANQADEGHGGSFRP